ncbi:MAG TPA: ribonuclease III [Candidatus Didemnitutus sp.]|nr:ribonuclease III [Candidatus Didemnitutus sp.]
MADPATLSALQDRIGHRFRRPELLSEALTHASYLQGHPENGTHNQRLEFLGDSVLQFILTDALFHDSPLEREGGLSRRRAWLTRGEFLSRLAADLGLQHALRLSASEEGAGGRGRASILEDALEALIGAIYLDSDLATTKTAVLGWYGPLGPRLAALDDAENPKGRLQELAQPEHGNGAIRYETIASTGPRHARQYEVAVFLHERQLGSGHGSSKKSAEEAAARVALATLRAETKL